MTKCYICEGIFKNCLIKIHKVTSLEYEPVSCTCVDKDLWKLKLFLPNTTKLLAQNPHSDFFRVWTRFMVVDKDFWKLKLFLQNTTVTKCYICEWIFKSYLIKIHKVTSLEYEPDRSSWILDADHWFSSKSCENCFLFQMSKAIPVSFWNEFTPKTWLQKH